MPRELLPIIGGKNQDPNETGLGLYGADTMNFYVSKIGTMNMRPALVLLCDLSTGQRVDSIFWVDNKGVALAVSGGHVFKLTDDQGSFTQLTVAETKLQSGIRATMAHFGTDTYLANGGKILKYDWSATPAFITDTDAPITVSHCAFFDNYLIANQVGSAIFHRSQPGDPDDWQGDYDTAESAPDNVTALMTANREIVLAGPESIEFWYNDNTSPFVRSETKIVSRGVIAPYSMVQVDGTWFFFSSEREFVALSGIVPIPISSDIARLFEGLTSVSDARADLIKYAGHRFYEVTFPAADRTFVYDVDLKLWYEWGYWNQQSAEYTAWPGICHCFCPGWNLNLVGSKDDGKIYKLSLEEYTDDGDIIRPLRRTTWIAHNTLRTKQSNGLYFLLKRTSLSGGSEIPNMVIKWRDDGDVNWSREYTVPIAKVGDTEFVGQLVGGLGQYIKRQYEFYITANYQVCISGIEEDYDVLWS